MAWGLPGSNGRYIGKQIRGEEKPKPLQELNTT
jgi:hypothetical protein